MAREGRGRKEAEERAGDEAEGEKLGFAGEKRVERERGVRLCFTPQKLFMSLSFG